MVIVKSSDQVHQVKNGQDIEVGLDVGRLYVHDSNGDIVAAFNATSWEWARVKDDANGDLLIWPGGEAYRDVVVEFETRPGTQGPAETS